MLQIAPAATQPPAAAPGGLAARTSALSTGCGAGACGAPGAPPARPGSSPAPRGDILGMSDRSQRPDADSGDEPLPRRRRTTLVQRQRSGSMLSLPAAAASKGQHRRCQSARGRGAGGKLLRVLRAPPTTGGCWRHPCAAASPFPPLLLLVCSSVCPLLPARCVPLG